MLSFDLALTKSIQQMEKAFTHARTKKGDAFRKREESKKVNKFQIHNA